MEIKGPHGRQENHMIAAFRGTALCSDTETPCAGLGSTGPGVHHPANMFRNVISMLLNRKKVTARTKAFS